MQNRLETLTRFVQFSAILLQLGGATLIALLFVLIRRQALHRKYFATWSTAWIAFAVAIGALGIRYFLIDDSVAGLAVQDSTLSVRVLYLLYQSGKLLFWTLVCRGTIEYAHPDHESSALWIPASLAYAVLSWAIAPDLNVMMVGQAPVAMLCCIAGALSLFELSPDRRSFGTVATGTVLLFTAVIWAVYLLVFARAAEVLPGGLPGILGSIARYNSYVDMLLLVMLGYAMIVQFMEEARTRISESESRLTALVATAGDAIVTADDGLHLLDANAAAERLFGMQRAAMVGRPVEQMAPPNERERFRAELESFIFSDVPTASLGASGDLHAVPLDGQPFVIEVSVSKLRANGRNAVALMVRDVTQRRQAEERKLQEQKMDAVRQLAGGLAHDFNNLLTAIVGRSQIIGRSLPADSAIRASVDEIERTAGTAARLTRGLLALSRRETLSPELLSLNAVVRSIELRIRELAGATIAVDFRYAEDPGSILADTARFREVVLGIVQNARESIGAGGGRIIVETSRVAWLREVGTSVETACLSVQDSGRGFAAEARAHLFEPFFSTKGDGRGLGLATAYAFLHQSGGWLDVQSSSNGATVRLALPSAIPDVVAAPRSRVTPTGIPANSATGSRSILVAEDEETVRRFVRIVLEKEGYRVVEAENGNAALELFAHDPSIEVLLTDVVMPQMGGRELATRLLVERPELRVIFMSGFVTDMDAIAGLGDRKAPFLQKPFDIEVLARVVREEMNA